ncbi:hypothetical protein AG1IA_05006 [Rhizoctonia solani AG-1 IA]|uniref:Uncharacterized protein n=1 Tax=Thanatephorus cucumeris (strain AG1-IA) TaxID=983506 RepID=L8WX86_THACA|nr:hypothetical protein AG1IA_05006 [Rhizoctonia solani AG-1 IA]
MSTIILGQSANDLLTPVIRECLLRSRSTG